METLKQKNTMPEINNSVENAEWRRWKKESVNSKLEQ